MRKIFATDFGIWPVMKGIEIASDAMLASKKQIERLANYLLLYDQIIIPTGNLQVLPVLRIFLGEDVFDDLIQRNVIVLVRYDEWIGYAGNGKGLVSYQVIKDPKKTERKPNLAHAYFTPLDEAIDIALSNTTPVSNSSRQSKLKNLLFDNIILLPTKQTLKDVYEESYEDILHSPYLKDLLSLRNAGRSINNLLGIKANQLTSFNPHFGNEDGDILEIQSVLRVAFENFLLKIASFAEVTDITGDDTSLNVLRAKGERIGFSPEGLNAFAKIQNVSGVPNIGVAFANKEISSSQLLDLRDSEHCQSLRDWFAVGSHAEHSEEILQRFVDSIGRKSWIESVPIKLIRIATVTGLGSLHPSAGIAASLIDNFLLSKWFPDNSPRLFLKEAKVLLTKPSSIPNPTKKRPR